MKAKVCLPFIGTGIFAILLSLHSLISGGDQFLADLAFVLATGGLIILIYLFVEANERTEQTPKA